MKIPLAILAMLSLALGLAAQTQPAQKPFAVPAMWEYTAPLISPEKRDKDQSWAQKDPSIIYHDGKWHVFMTIKTQGRTPIEYCSFDKWENADKAPRTILNISDSNYYCAPQIFYFTPHKKWYLVYQVGIPKQKMWVACSTTDNINDPASWTKAAPILDGGPNDPRKEGGGGGLDYWIICDDARAYLFFTNLKGDLLRTSTKLEDFPRNFGPCEVALHGKFLEASHTYKLKNQQKFLTIIEENGQRYYKAYLADSLAGKWTALADTFDKPFASAKNIRPVKNVDPWTDNVSHGELVRDSIDEHMTIDPDHLQFVFQGMLEKDKNQKGYGAFQWRIGILTPTSSSPPQK